MTAREQITNVASNYEASGSNDKNRYETLKTEIQ